MHEAHGYLPLYSGILVVTEKPTWRQWYNEQSFRINHKVVSSYAFAQQVINAGVYIDASKFFELIQVKIDLDHPHAQELQDLAHTNNVTVIRRKQI